MCGGRDVVLIAVVDKMSRSRGLDRQLMEAAKRKDVGEIQRLVKQEGADVDCRNSDVCYCLREQVVLCGEISFIFIS